MPTYDYKCDKCEHEFEAFQSITDEALSQCPECGAHSLRRLIGAGAGLIFKGSGFYITDYKGGRSGSSSNSSTESASTSTAESNSSAGDKSSTDSKDSG
jgi:putative FmdB family regulatory protein